MTDIPPALLARPHWGNLPIPWITFIDRDGRPDFRVHDQWARRRAADHRLCQLCGEDLGAVMVFVGSEESAARGVFGEPPMHPNCWSYARKVCPWLQGRPVHDREAPEGASFIERAQDPRYLRVMRCREFVTVGWPLRWVAQDQVGVAEWYIRPTPPAET